MLPIKSGTSKTPFLINGDLRKKGVRLNHQIPLDPPQHTIWTLHHIILYYITILYYTHWDRSRANYVHGWYTCMINIPVWHISHAVGFLGCDQPQMKHFHPQGHHPGQCGCYQKSNLLGQRSPVQSASSCDNRGRTHGCDRGMVSFHLQARPRLVQQQSLLATCRKTKPIQVKRDKKLLIRKLGIRGFFCVRKNPTENVSLQSEVSQSIMVASV